MVSQIHEIDIATLSQRTHYRFTTYEGQGTGKAHCKIEAYKNIKNK